MARKDYEETKRYSREYRKKNPEKCNAYAREYYRRMAREKPELTKEKNKIASIKARCRQVEIYNDLLSKSNGICKLCNQQLSIVDNKISLIEWNDQIEMLHGDCGRMLKLSDYSTELLTNCIKYLENSSAEKLV